MFFTRFFFRIVSGTKFVRNYHHDEIVDELHNVANYKTKFLNINIPPRYTKTELAAVMFISWSIAKNPRANFMYITGSDKLANETSVKIRKIVTSYEYRTMFGIALSSDQKAKGIWRTKQGGGLMVATIMGQITGFGAGSLTRHLDDEGNRLFEGGIILDDINKIMAAIKNTATNKTVNEVIFNTVIPSRQNSTDTPIINIQQRAGANDATKRLKDHFGLRDKNESEILRDKGLVSIVYPVITDGIPLWEFKHNLQDIELLKMSPETRYTFQCQYMQNPRDEEGLVFHEDSLKRFSLKNYNNQNREGNFSYIDTADKGTDNYSQPFGDLIGSKVYLVDVVYNQDILPLNRAKSALKMSQHDTLMTRVETNKEGSLYVENLRNESGNRYVDGIFNTSNKHSRIISFEEIIKKYFVFRDDYEIDSEYDYFMQELTSYLRDGSNEHDDAPDSLAGLARFLWDRYKHLFLQP